MQQKMQAAAEVAVKQCLGVKKSDTVLVVTDTKICDIGRVLFYSALKHAKDASMVVISPRTSHGEEPPEAIARLMKNYDVLFIPTYRSMSHTNARREACANGARCATLPNIIPDTLIRAVNADYQKIANLSDKLAAILTEAKHARVTTPNGTDLSFSLETRRGLSDTGIVHQPGGFTNLPAGEAYAAPLEGTAQGVYVIDGSINDTGVLQEGDYIRVEVADGYATSIEGGKSAEIVRKAVEPYGKDALNIAELGIGTNYKAKIIGNVLEDEKVMKTVHIAIGDNQSMGGKIRVPSHLDGILLNPDLYIDDLKIMEHGEFLV